VRCDEKKEKNRNLPYKIQTKNETEVCGGIYSDIPL
jgi:hypothetical protein